MPRAKQKIKFVAHLNPDQYWQVQYLITVTKRDISELIEEAVKSAVRYMDENPNKNYHKIERQKNYKDQTAYITRDSDIALKLVKINNDMDGWSRNAFVRYGLRKVLASYAVRYPELNKIARKYEEKNEN
jgi:Arc/MetJ-type ribon-helix-helix transcriptional regulator